MNSQIFRSDLKGREVNYTNYTSRRDWALNISTSTQYEALEQVEMRGFPGNVACSVPRSAKLYIQCYSNCIYPAMLNNLKQIKTGKNQETT